MARYSARHISLGLAALLAVACSTPGICGKATYAHKMEMGNLLFFNGDTDRAIKAFHDACELNPKAFEPHLNLVNLYVQKGDEESLEMAIQECYEVLKLKPGHKDVHLILGNLRRSQASSATDPEKMKAKLEEAVKEIEAAKLSGADKALCENTLGLIHLQKGDHETALTHIEEALKAKPVFADAHLIKAVLLFKGAGKVETKGQDTNVTVDFTSPAMKEKLERVLKELDLSIEQKDKNAEAHNTKADILTAMGKLDDALDEYKDAVEADPRYAQGWSGIGNCSAQLAGKESDSEKKQKLIEEAKDAYEKARRLKPGDKNIIYGLAIMLEKLGMINDAIQEFQAGVLMETDPMMKASITMHIQQLQQQHLGGNTTIGGPSPTGGINGMYDQGALSIPFKNLIQVGDKDKNTEKGKEKAKNGTASPGNF